MLNKYKPAIITLSIIALIAFGIVDYVKHLIDQPTEGFNKLQELSGNNTVIPKEFEFNGAKIALAWTDDNTGEDLIIQSDKKIYSGFNNAEVYFSITNITKEDQEADINFIFENDDGSLEKIEQLKVNGKALTAPSAGAALGAVRAGQTNFYKATLKFPPMTKGEFLIEANGDKGGYGLLDPWYNSNWSYWKKITINSSQIATTTSNFPVLATSTDSDLRTTTNGGHVGNDNGYDIVFAGSDGETLLNFEREYYASTTGEIVYWIKTDISSTTDKVIYMYYGNASASDLATTTGVWDDNFVMVQHLQETPAGTTYDSTKYDNDGTTSGMDNADQVAGQIDGSLDFDGGDDYVDCGQKDIYNPDNFTVSFFVQQTDDGALYRGILGNNGDDTWMTTGWGFYFTDDGICFHLDQYDKTSCVSLLASDRQWHYITGIYNGSTIVIEMDGNQGSPYSISSYTAGNRILTFGKTRYPSTPIKLDEVRISNIARTVGWIETEYNNQVSVGDFMTFGAEVCIPKPVERSGGENVKTMIKGGTRIKGGVRF